MVVNPHCFLKSRFCWMELHQEDALVGWPSMANLRPFTRYPNIWIDNCKS
uniref:Uncharacterized protein n=1 Tax=Arundo donax TaxID=35708 RepID=A0A0A9BBM3_ARUDO